MADVTFGRQETATEKDKGKWHKYYRPEGDPDAMRRLRRIAKKYYGRSNFHGFRVIFYDWAVIFLVAIGLELLRLRLPLLAFLPVYLLGALMIGSRFRGMENLVHEASHFNLFKTREWNDQLEFLFALPVFRTAADFRNSHLVHHNNLGHEEIDPDLHRYAEWGVMDLPKNFWWIMVARPFTGFLTFHYFKYEMLRFWQSPTSRASKIVFWVVVLGLITVLGAWQYALLYWIIPFFVILPIPRFWSVISEHGGLDLRHDIASSRNTVGSALQQWFIFPHNDGYHETHHLYAGIPWYQIHKADQELMADPYYAEYCMVSRNLYVTADHMFNHEIITFSDEEIAAEML